MSQVLFTKAVLLYWRHLLPKAGQMVLLLNSHGCQGLQIERNMACHECVRQGHILQVGSQSLSERVLAGL